VPECVALVATFCVASSRKDFHPVFTKLARFLDIASLRLGVVLWFAEPAHTRTQLAPVTRMNTLNRRFFERLQRAFARALWLVAFGLLLQTATRASANCKVTGSVTDPSGAAIANATVTVVSLHFQATTETDRQGRYWFGGLPAGRVELTVEAKGRLELSRVKMNALRAPLTALPDQPLFWRCVRLIATNCGFPL
jgi:hypothetical protein